MIYKILSRGFAIQLILITGGHSAFFQTNLGGGLDEGVPWSSR